MNALLEIVRAVSKRQSVEPFLVGGSVRDRLLDRPCHDLDFACRHAQRVAKAVARRLGRKLITLDEQNRIYRIVQEGTTLDFAEMQGKSIETDLARRDFTINAMAIPLTLALSPRERGGVGGWIDPFGGQKDLQRKVLRALSRKAFQEDALRLLRAYRMVAQFDLQMEPRTARWIRAESHRLENGQVARERIREELLRLLNLNRCAPAVAAMDHDGLLTTIFPELEAGRRIGLAYYGKGGIVKHHLQSVANVEWLLERLASERPGLAYFSTPAIVDKVRTYVSTPMGGVSRAAFLKLGALLHDVGKPATAQVIKGRLRFFGHEDVGAQQAHKLLAKMRFSRHEGGLIRTWVANHMRPGNLAAAPQVSDKAMARFFRDMGEEGIGMLIVSLGDHYTYLARSKWGKGTDTVEQTARRLVDAYYLQRESVLPPKLIDGHVLLKRLGLKPGPVIGKLLEAVKDAQAEKKVRTAAEAVAFAKSILKKVLASTKRDPSRSA